MITVLTTVRNGMPFISEAIESVRAQKYPLVRHCIVDDGSTDGTSDFLGQDENRDIIAVHGGAVGRGRALNLGVGQCRTDYLAILDADDVASPGWLSAMVALMEDNLDIAVLSCRGVLDRGSMDVSLGGPLNLRRLFPEAFLYRNPVHHSGTLMRAEVLREAGGYDESRDCLFDYELWTRLLKKGKQIWCIDNGLVFKRIHSGQHFERGNRLRYLRAGYQIRRGISMDLLGGDGAMVPALIFFYGLLPRRLRHWIYIQNNLERTR